MQNSIVTSVLLFIVLSCNNSNNNPPADAGTATDTTLKHDTAKHAEQVTANPGSDSNSIKKSFPESKDIFMVEEKMKNKAVLNDVDYAIIGKFLTQNKDESLWEGVGMTLYEYLPGNRSANEGIDAYLNKKGNTYKEKVLGKLIETMCIDLGEDKYTYDKLISDFPLFKGSNAAQKALNTCIANHLD
ncbi:hypothetical protein A3860_36370 [Niastella vici]|uniref:Uncharacterized protein n=1 Tax=Niastella vici TaxID=1703345 RepID=A0A1V9FN78_9BACT|nr:hypothetical protein [Niastella vici]OQP59757.1 hypothetical protein A3860_36370 [Niastella vici]